jgi:beta-lactamase class A
MHFPSAAFKGAVDLLARRQQNRRRPLARRFTAGWRVGDKTGSGERGTTNDVGVAWPPQSEPILIAVYLTATAANAEARNRTIAAVGGAIAAWLRG